MNIIQNYLEQLGFSKMEIKIYLKLLSNGPQTVSEIANAIKMNRTATYPYIQTLLKKGVINKITGVSSKIEANPPEHLQYLLDQKAGKIRIMQDSFPTIINSINTTFPLMKTANKSEIKYYKNKSGVKVIYDEALQAKELRSYFKISELKKVFPENTQLFENALRNKKIMMYEITEDTEQARKTISFHFKNNNYFCKFLPNDIKLTSNDILIYDKKVAIINVGDKNSIDGVVLSNADYYNNSKQLFDLLWRFLPDPGI